MDNPSPPSSFMRRAVGSLAQLTYVTFEVIGAVIDNVGGLRRTDLYDQVSRLRTTVMDLAMENARLKEESERSAEVTEGKCNLLGLGWCSCDDCRFPS